MIEFWFNFLDSNPCTFISSVPFYTAFLSHLLKKYPHKRQGILLPTHKKLFSSLFQL